MVKGKPGFYTILFHNVMSYLSQAFMVDVDECVNQ
jgi:hypothetical protein